MVRVIFLISLFSLSTGFWAPALSKNEAELFHNDCVATVGPDACVDAYKLRMKGDFNGALRLYNSEIEKEGTNASVYLYTGRGDTFYLLKDFKKALENYAIAFSKSPIDNTAPLQMAYCWYKMGDFRKARIDLKIAQKINNYSPCVLCLDGLLNAATGKTKEALVALKVATSAQNMSYLSEEQKADAFQVIRSLESKKRGT